MYMTFEDLFYDDIDYIMEEVNDKQVPVRKNDNIIKRLIKALKELFYKIRMRFKQLFIRNAKKECDEIQSYIKKNNMHGVKIDVPDMSNDDANLKNGHILMVKLVDTTDVNKQDYFLNLYKRQCSDSSNDSMKLGGRVKSGVKKVSSTGVSAVKKASKTILVTALIASIVIIFKKGYDLFTKISNIADKALQGKDVVADNITRIKEGAEAVTNEYTKTINKKLRLLRRAKKQVMRKVGITPDDASKNKASKG